MTFEILALNFLSICGERLSKFTHEKGERGLGEMRQKDRFIFIDFNRAGAHPSTNRAEGQEDPLDGRFATQETKTVLTRTQTSGQLAFSTPPDVHVSGCVAGGGAARNPHSDRAD